VNKLVFVALGLGLSLAIGACSVEAGVGVAAAGTPCESISCQAAAAQGLDVQGDDLCDAASSSAYNTLLDCACLSGGGQGLCDPECGGNLCLDNGADGPCGDCLTANCGAEFNSCGAN